MQSAAGREGAAVRHIFKIHGLDCAEEVAVLKRAIGPLVGGEERLAFNVLNGRMSVLERADLVGADAIRKAVAGTGMTAEEWHADRIGDGTADKHRRRQILFTVASGGSLLAGLGLHVWLAGGFMEAIRLFAGHNGHGMPRPEAAAFGLAILFGIRFRTAQGMVRG